MSDPLAHVCKDTLVFLPLDVLVPLWELWLLVVPLQAGCQLLLHARWLGHRLRRR